MFVDSARFFPNGDLSILASTVTAVIVFQTGKPIIPASGMLIDESIVPPGAFSVLLSGYDKFLQFKYFAPPPSGPGSQPFKLDDDMGGSYNWNKITTWFWRS